MCVCGGVVILRCSAATLFTCDGVVNYNFIVHLLLSVTVTGLKNRETFGKVTGNIMVAPLRHTVDNVLITFCVSRRRRKMYCNHALLCVCLSVCLSVCDRMPTLLHGPGCNLGRGRGCPLVVHYWADLQSGHGLRCYGNITRNLVTSLRSSRDMTT